MKALIVHLSDMHLRKDANRISGRFASIVAALQNQEVDLAVTFKTLMTSAAEKPVLKLRHEKE